MIRMFRTMDDTIQQVEETFDGVWIALTAPTQEELKQVAETCGVEIDHLRAPLDEEERSRIEVEDSYTMTIVDIPVTEERQEKEYYVTIPCGIIITKTNIITICLEDTPILEGFMDGRVRNFYTYRKTRFFLQILNRNAAMYLQYLRMIDKKSDEVEKKLHISTTNEELIDLLELEKSLVYFTTSLRSNQVVFERMLKAEAIKKYPEDEDLLEDVIIENEQAIEMADIYSDILSGTMDAYASVISNNLNIVMKALAVITIVMSIPTMIASFWGMNVSVPLEQNPHGFALMITFSILMTFAGYRILVKKNLF